MDHCADPFLLFLSYLLHQDTCLLPLTGPNHHLCHSRCPGRACFLGMFPLIAPLDLEARCHGQDMHPPHSVIFSCRAPSSLNKAQGWPPQDKAHAQSGPVSASITGSKTLQERSLPRKIMSNSPVHRKPLGTLLSCRTWPRR